MRKLSFCSKNLKFTPYHERLKINRIRIKTFMFCSKSNAKLDSVLFHYLLQVLS